MSLNRIVKYVKRFWQQFFSFPLTEFSLKLGDGPYKPSNFKKKQIMWSNTATKGANLRLK